MKLAIVCLAGGMAVAQEVTFTNNSCTLAGSGSIRANGGDKGSCGGGGRIAVYRFQFHALPPFGVKAVCANETQVGGREMTDYVWTNAGLWLGTLAVGRWERVPDQSNILSEITGQINMVDTNKLWRAFYQIVGEPAP